MKAISKIYSELYKKFGPQYWWPVTLEEETIPKYHKKITHSEKQKLEICFGAILTQNTNWKNVEKAIINLNKNNLIDIKKINRINNNKLALIIRSSGYHNQKAIKLKNFCQYINKHYNNDLKKLFNGNLDLLRIKLLSINGIGPETADSMILYAAQKPIFVIDAYTNRIYSRIFKKELKYDELQTAFMENLNQDKKLFNEFHALLVELGKNTCKTKPLCQKCPVNSMCNYYKTNY